MKKIASIFLLGFLLTNLYAQRGRVQIQNGTVVTDKGTLLRGCYDRYWKNDFTWEDMRQDVNEIKNLGLNCLKMYAGGAGPDDLEDWVPYIDSLVKWTREDSLYFVITPSWYRNIGTEEEPNYIPDIDFIRRYWSFYAERYKDETHMIFDICNEPEERSNYDTLILQMQLDAYDSIRAHAPETHIMFFSSVYTISIDSVFNWLKEIDKHVDWSNASVAMHGYCLGVSEEVKAFNQQMIDSGYTLIISEFESVLHPGYAGRALIRVFEEQGLSYLNFLEADVIADHPEYFKTMIEKSEIRWTPDFGTWPESLTEIDYYDPFKFRWSALYDEGKGWYFGPYPSDDQEYVKDNAYAAYYNLNFDTEPATFEVMCSSDGGEGEIEIHLDSLNGPLVGVCAITNTGNWNTYESFTCEITYPFTGVHKIYLVYKSSGEEYLFNVRAWYFGKSELEAPQTPYHGEASVIPGKVEAEEYDIGGPAISYLDKDTVNEGLLFREDEVDIDTVDDGGYCIAWTGENEWLEYTVSCEHDTVMDIQLRAACWESGNKFNIKLDNEKLATVYLDSVGSYYDWQIITIEDITIPAGENQILRLELLDGNFNIDWLNFVEHVPSGINWQKEVSSIKIYPNPATEYLTVQTPERGILDIWSVQGRLLRTIHMEEGLNYIAVGDLKPGNYLIKVFGQNSIYTDLISIQ